MYDYNTNTWTEPDADERELAMGYELGSTAVEGVSVEKRRQLLSQAIDLNALYSLVLASDILTADVASAAAKPPGQESTRGGSPDARGHSDNLCCRH